MIDTQIALRCARTVPHLDKRARRLFAASEAHAGGGPGGVAAAAGATGVARSTIGRGFADLRDGEKKKLVKDFKSGRRELRPKGDPEPVRVHDFVLPERGKVAPYCVSDIAANCPPD